MRNRIFNNRKKCRVGTHILLYVIDLEEIIKKIRGICDVFNSFNIKTKLQFVLRQFFPLEL